MSVAYGMNEVERQALLEELAASLEALHDRTCPEMAALWIDGTRRERTELGEATFTRLPFEMSERYRKLGPSGQTKYRGLALWRFAVLWREVAARVPEPEHRDALLAMYFTPYPLDEPPYSWSQRASAAPDVARFGGPSELKKFAKEGCWHSLVVLVSEAKRLEVATGTIGAGGSYGGPPVRPCATS